MIVVGFNGFTRSAELFGRLYRRSGLDRYRVLGHDAAVAVVVDGELVAAVEEERLSRVKKTSDLPVNALRWALREAGVELADVDRFAFPWSFTAEVWATERAGILRSAAAEQERADRLARLEELRTTLLTPEAIRADFAARTGFTIPPDRLRLVPHHLAHLSCGYHTAGWRDAAFLVSDGRAERYSSIMGEIRDGEVTILADATVDIANSLALLYSKVTRYLGFVPNNDEYKVMGLSGFHPPLGADNPLLREVVTLEDTGGYRLRVGNPLLDTQAYYPFFDQIFECAGDRTDWHFRCRVARAVQDTVEVVTRHQVAALERRTSARRLIIEGGLALNCVNNTKLLEGSRFEDASVSFGASDPGVTIGAAVYASRELGRPVRPSGLPYLGPRYTDDDVRAALAAVGDRVEWRELAEDELFTEVAKLLVDPVVIGWFQGAVEYGPRALGNRSILANPAFPDIQDVINIRVKRREPFRPFAPVLPAASAPRVLELGKKKASPYMTFVFPVRPEYRTLVPGAVHVDGTARAQTVDEADNPLLAGLLHAFEQVTGVPCLINTSFNVAGQPIVGSPADALSCFLDTEIDYLVLHHFLISKVASGES
ncbi:carbamoyltransferase C-terminal domain-containing protein [Micromonospora sp. RP3T]|uniref:carbamoyltransferase family protein n=1 Tax=Micromonospora sp. RP3T TaxID=2135446 RepID=UPI000D153C30|nr:carbamoyltransferase C-terminal domain-containing protein [Micromonospora sp. RP3T]PTA47788.1 carbamoyltransferase [Micromonospora sp. RP3T]